MNKHLVSLHALIRSAANFEELEAMAGVCNRNILWCAVERCVRQPAQQWEKLLALLRRRIALRYERGELRAFERRAFDQWAGARRNRFSV